MPCQNINQCENAVIWKWKTVTGNNYRQLKFFIDIFIDRAFEQEWHRCVTLFNRKPFISALNPSFKIKNNGICFNPHTITSQSITTVSNYHFILFVFMFNPTRSQIFFVLAIVIGLVIGKLIKNFKVAFAITLILMVAFSISFKKR